MTKQDNSLYGKEVGVDTGQRYGLAKSAESDPKSSQRFLSGHNGSQLRVLFAIDSDFPRLGGAENQALKLAMSLREQGAYVEFVAPRGNKSQALDESYKGFTITRIDYLHLRWVGSLLLMFRFARYLVKNQHRFDAVHIHITHLLAASAGYVRSKVSIPVITKVSGYYEFEGGVLDLSAKFKPLNYLIRRGLTKVDFVQTISIETREKLLAAGFTDNQIQFIPNGIDTSILPVPSRTANDVVRIGYCGRLRKIKGVHVLLEAFAKLLQYCPRQPLQLVIAGSGDAKSELDDLASKLGITSHIHWLGTIEDTQSFFEDIELYVQPSFAEGLPNSVMEAMAANRAVVASRIGGNTDLIEDKISGLLFRAGDAEALAEQLHRLIRNSEEAHRLALTGRQRIEAQYGFELVTRQLSELYLA